MSGQYSEAEIGRIAAVKGEIRASEVQDHDRYLQLADFVLEHLTEEKASKEKCIEVLGELSGIKGDEIEVGKWLASEIAWRSEREMQDLAQLEA